MAAPDGIPASQLRASPKAARRLFFNLRYSDPLLRVPDACSAIPGRALRVVELRGVQQIVYGQREQGGSRIRAAMNTLLAHDIRWGSGSS